MHLYGRPEDAEGTETCPGKVPPEASRGVGNVSAMRHGAGLGHSFRGRLTLDKVMEFGLHWAFDEYGIWHWLGLSKNPCTGRLWYCGPYDGWVDVDDWDRPDSLGTQMN